MTIDGRLDRVILPCSWTFGQQHLVKIVRMLQKEYIYSFFNIRILG
jgi:hypothetical protein